MTISHILIRHKASNGVISGFRIPGCAPDPAVDRSREAAATLAGDLYRRLQQNPTEYARFAEQYSEDPVTAPWGGTLGTMTASRLPAQFLDAIAAMNEGGISYPVETPFGFHILKLTATPPNQTVSASRIVIPYDGCSLSAPRPNHYRGRSHSEAIKLADQIFAQAVSETQPFSEFVNQYSETADATIGGDIGAWETLHSDGKSLEIAAIAELPVGGIAKPIDSPDGIEIFQRTSHVSRATYALEYIAVPYSSAAERATTEMRIHDILVNLRGEPSKFDRYRQTLCCSDPIIWTEGRAVDPALELAVTKLNLNELSFIPVVTPYAFYVVKRIPVPEPTPEEAVLFRLPSPATANLAEVVPYATTYGIAQTIRALAEAIPSAVPLSPAERHSVEVALKALGEDLLRVRARERVGVVTNFWQALPLPSTDVQALQAFTAQFVSTLMMNQ